MDIKDVQNFFLRSFASYCCPYYMSWEEWKKEIEKELEEENDKSN